MNKTPQAQPNVQTRGHKHEDKNYKHKQVVMNK
jgi:hypothetical protein